MSKQVVYSLLSFIVTRNITKQNQQGPNQCLTRVVRVHMPKSSSTCPLIHKATLMEQACTEGETYKETSFCFSFGHCNMHPRILMAYRDSGSDECPCIIMWVFLPTLEAHDPSTLTLSSCIHDRLTGLFLWQRNILQQGIFQKYLRRYVNRQHIIIQKYNIHIYILSTQSCT